MNLKFFHLNTICAQGCIRQAPASNQANGGKAANKTTVLFSSNQSDLVGKIDPVLYPESEWSSHTSIKFYNEN